MLEYFEEQLKISTPYTEEQILERDKNLSPLQVGDVQLFLMVRKKEPKILEDGTKIIQIQLFSSTLKEIENPESDLICGMQLKFTHMNGKLPVFAEI